MPECVLKSWDQFEEKIAELKKSYSSNISELWFRGQPNSTWPLVTTLERRVQATSVYEYYRIILSIKSEIETFTGRSFATPNFDEITKFCTEYDLFSRSVGFGNLPGCEYMVYLRHHGFPSPLLDWTRSPYVAAYFAFREVSKSNAASIYVFAEQPDHMKFRSSDEASIYSIGPNISAHRRHFLQKATYTICIYLDHDKNGWQFVSHEKVFEREGREIDFRQDVLWKITIPSSERLKVLKSLDEYNLHAFSLFGSEESLMESLAIQNFDFEGDSVSTGYQPERVVLEGKDKVRNKS